MADPTLTERARAVLAGLVQYERDVLADFATGTPRRWGAAISQALEVLLSRECVTRTFRVTDLGHEIARLHAEGSA